MEDMATSSNSRPKRAASQRRQIVVGDSDKSVNSDSGDSWDSSSDGAKTVAAAPQTVQMTEAIRMGSKASQPLKKPRVESGGDVKHGGFKWTFTHECKAREGEKWRRLYRCRSNPKSTCRVNLRRITFLDGEERWEPSSGEVKAHTCGCSLPKLWADDPRPLLTLSALPAKYRLAATTRETLMHCLRSQKDWLLMVGEELRWQLPEPAKWSADLKAILQYAMKGVLQFLASENPWLKHSQMTVIRSDPGAPSQREVAGKFHQDYSPRTWEAEFTQQPMSAIFALDSFTLEYSPNERPDTGPFRELTVEENHLVRFTNRLWHGGGANKSRAAKYRVFFYLAATPSHIPNGEVFYFTEGSVGGEDASESSIDEWAAEVGSSSAQTLGKPVPHVEAAPETAAVEVAIPPAIEVHEVGATSWFLREALAVHQRVLEALGGDQENRRVTRGQRQRVLGLPAPPMAHSTVLDSESQW